MQKVLYFEWKERKQRVFGGYKFCVISIRPLSCHKCTPQSKQKIDYDRGVVRLQNIAHNRRGGGRSLDKSVWWSKKKSAPSAPYLLPCPKHALVQGTPPRFFAPPFGFIREFVPKTHPCLRYTPRSDRTFFLTEPYLGQGGGGNIPPLGF